MPRTAVVTGSASGIGRATCELLVQRGERVIGADLRNADVIADLGSAEGRAALVEGVRRLSGGRIDAVYAIAGLAVPGPATVAVNFFGTLATLEGLRPLLTGSTSPRAVAVSSMAALMPAAPEWAGAGVSLNAAAPGIIATPMTAGLIATAEGRRALLEAVPMPLNGIAEPLVVARALAWLGGEENTHLCGQIVYVDGGSDAVLRGDSVW